MIVSLQSVVAAFFIQGATAHPLGDLGRAPSSVFSTLSTPARLTTELSFFVLLITGGIFLSVSGLLLYALVKYRAREGDSMEPAQVFGSTQIELSWTIIPILIIVVLFLGTGRVIFAVQDAAKPPAAVDVTVVGHQFWWEFRYPKYGIVTANELHVPVSTSQSPRPTYLKLTSADVMHSFWVPRLAGKTDLLPNRVNEMWVDPHQTGMYEGQCAQFCGPQHAKMLLRVYVESPEQFQIWVANQQNSQAGKTAGGTANEVSAGLASPPVGNSASGGSGTGTPAKVSASQGKVAGVPEGDSETSMPEQGRRVFESQACINCHAVAGTVANGRYGPDLTHLMSRDTLAAGAISNTPAHLVEWIADPNEIKPGSLMPAMHLTERENRQIAAYLMTLH